MEELSAYRTEDHDIHSIGAKPPQATEHRSEKLASIGRNLLRQSLKPAEFSEISEPHFNLQNSAKACMRMEIHATSGCPRGTQLV